MKPEKLVISGWGSYKDRIEIDFTKFEGRGLFLVTGATGAGKTTIFDAITYALYGSLSGDMREKNSVRSDFADPDTPTFVEMFMMHDGKEYHILRNPEYVRRKKRAKNGALTKEKENAVLYLPDGHVLEGIREVNAKVQEILVLDYQQFKQITMIAQGEFARLLTAPPKDKTRIFRDIFGTGIYEQFTQALRAKSGELYGKVMEQRHKLEEDVNMLLVNRRIETKQLAVLTETDNWNYTAVEEALAELAGEISDKEKTLQKVGSVLQAESEKITQKLARKKLENEQIERLEKAKENLQRLLKKDADIQTLKRRVNCARQAEMLLPYKVKEQTGHEAYLRAEANRERLCESSRQAESELKVLRPFDSMYTEIWQSYLESGKAFQEKKQEAEELFGDAQKIKTEWEKTKQAFLEAEQIYDKKRKAYDKAEQIYRHAVVGLAAAMLEKGKPCPVCGSLEHPNPAECEPEVLTETELNTLKEEVALAQQKLFEKQEKAAVLKNTVNELERREQQLQTFLEEEARRTKSLKETLRKKAACTEVTFWQADLQKQEKQIQANRERITALKATLAACREHMGEAQKDVAERKQEWQASVQAYDRAVKQAGFADTVAAEAAQLSGKEITRLEQEAADYAKELTEVQSVISHLKDTVGNNEFCDLTSLLKKAEWLGRQQAECQKQQKNVHAFHEEVKKTRMQFKEKMNRILAAKEEYGYVKDLDNLASGNNAKHLVFEQYVLAGYFEEILRAANLRFHKMTGGRYEMSRVEEAGDGRVKDSLEIQIMDYYTGKSRSVKTLSGGESFKASLSLALGMSDVIQAMNGGIKVDTLFIDEGFGALDTESLDQACQTLTGLVEQNRLIGIISHVPELRERIACQIVVDKTNSGSTVKIRV